MNQPENAIVLGVGPEGASAGLVFAVAEARRDHRPLHLVHVLQLPAGEAYAGVYGGALDLAKGTLDAALDRTKELAAGDVPVTGEVADNGWTVHNLVAHSSSAALLVLEHRHLNKVRRLVTGSFSNGVAARSLVPVVSVPEDWDPDAPRPRVVTVAVQDPHEAALLLATALEQAQLRGAELAVLHAWWLASGYDTTVVDQSMRDELTADFKDRVSPVLEDLTPRYPGARVRVDVRHAPPVEAILDASMESELVVIGRRHHLLPLGTHLGPVARATLDRAGCPVLVTPEATTTAAPDRPSSLASTAQ